MKEPQTTSEQNVPALGLPAVCLMASALICLAALALGMLFDISIVAASMNHQSNVYQHASTRIAYSALMGMFNIWIIRGGWEMLRLRSYKAARMSAILACIPCVGPCFVMGIPFGIWALFKLNDPSVKKAFTNLD